MSKVKVRYLVNGYKTPRGTEQEVDAKTADRLEANRLAVRVKAAPQPSGKQSDKG